jgi:hypothetical protein
VGVGVAVGVGEAVGVGVAVGVSVAVGVGEAVAVGVGVGVNPQMRSVSVVATVVEPLKPPALTSRLLPTTAPETKDRDVFKLGALTQVLVVGL